MKKNIKDMKFFVQKKLFNEHKIQQEFGCNSTPLKIIQVNKFTKKDVFNLSLFYLKEFCLDVLGFEYDSLEENIRLTLLTDLYLEMKTDFINRQLYAY